MIYAWEVMTTVSQRLFSALPQHSCLNSRCSSWCSWGRMILDFYTMINYYYCRHAQSFHLSVRTMIYFAHRSRQGMSPRPCLTDCIHGAASLRKQSMTTVVVCQFDSDPLDVVFIHYHLLPDMTVTVSRTTPRFMNRIGVRLRDLAAENPWRHSATFTTLGFWSTCAVCYSLYSYYLCN